MVQAILWYMEIAGGSSLYRLPNADNEVIHELPPGWIAVFYLWDCSQV